MLALAVFTSGQQLQPLCAMENSFANNASHANHDPSATSERAAVSAVLCNVAARRGAQHIHHSPASPAPTVLCADRVGQMTKTYNDIDAVTRLLEEVGCPAYTWSVG